MARRDDAWWETQATRIPTTPVNTRAKRRWRGFLLVYMTSAVLLFPLALFAIFVLAARSVSGQDTTAPAPAAMTLEAAQAQVVVETWIADDPSPLPGGRVLGLTGTTTAAPEAVENGEAPNYTLTTYRFLLTDKDRRLYASSVQMAVSPSGAVPLSPPAAVPLPTAGSDDSAQGAWPWPGTAEGAASQAHETAVKAWAAAFTSGDPTQLKQTVGDPDPARSYQPLIGATLKSTSVDLAGYRWADGENEDNPAGSATVIARVTLNISWAADIDNAAPVTYDVLLARANTATPVVVAWAPPGDPLAPFGNGHTRSVQAGQPTGPATSSSSGPPSSSASTSTSSTPTSSESPTGGR